MRALVTGATGFVGGELLAHLERPVVLSRNVESARRRLERFQPEVYAWDPLVGPPPQQAFEGVDTVFHLAGEPVAGRRWSAAQKEKIRASRTIGTRNLVETLRHLTDRPRTLVSASAVGYYGSRGDDVLTESAPAAHDFLADVCQQWERESQAATPLGIRVVNPRIGLVLGHGGALPMMLTPFKLGLGGRLGSGRQWMCWIHVADLVGLLLHAAQNDSIQGPMNAVSPNPVTNREFTQALAHALHRPAFLPAPYLGLRLLFGEFASVLFASQRVLPEVASRTGYRFEYPKIGAALESIVGKHQPSASHAKGAA